MNPLPLVNVVCFDSGHLLYDIFQVREVSDIDLGVKGVFDLQICFCPFCDKGFGKDCSKGQRCNFEFCRDFELADQRSKYCSQHLKISLPSNVFAKECFWIKSKTFSACHKQNCSSCNILRPGQVDREFS